MRIRKSGIGLNNQFAPFIVKETPYNAMSTDVQKTVNTTPIVFLAGAALLNHLLIVSNVSTSGQTIRIGDALVSFGAPVAGAALYPGDSFEIDGFATGGLGFGGFFAVADAAGGLLDIIAMQTAV